MIGITRSEFESSLMRQDVVEYYLAMPRGEIDYKFGDIVSDMVGYSQNNPHHCYDLFEHTLRTVKDIPTGELSYREIMILKIAAFLHDVGKPNVAQNVNGRTIYVGNEIESSKMAREFLNELGYPNQEIEQICFLIEHIDDFLYYKDEVPYYYEHHIVIRKISPKSIAEKMLSNDYDFKKLGLSENQIKAVCYTIINGDIPLFEDEKGNEIKIAPVNMEEIKCKISEVRKDYIASLRDYKLLMKLTIANYRAQAKRSYQRGRLIATRAEKVRVAAIIEGIIPEAYNLYKNTIEKYQADGELTQELIDATNEHKDLVTMNRIEQIREENAKNLLTKYNDMKIRLTMKS